MPKQRRDRDSGAALGRGDRRTQWFGEVQHRARRGARLGLAFLDTGAMYRAATWLALHRGVRPDRHRRRGRAWSQSADIDLVLEPDGFTIAIDGTDVTEAIRAPEVSAAVSAVATNLDVRADLVARQKQLIAETPSGDRGRGPRHHHGGRAGRRRTGAPGRRPAGPDRPPARRAGRPRGCPTRRHRPGDPPGPRRLDRGPVHLGGARAYIVDRLHRADPGPRCRRDLRPGSPQQPRRPAP